MKNMLFEYLKCFMEMAQIDKKKSFKTRQTPIKNLCRINLVTCKEKCALDPALVPDEDRWLQKHPSGCFLRRNHL